MAGQTTEEQLGRRKWSPKIGRKSKESERSEFCCRPKLSAEKREEIFLLASDYSRRRYLLDSLSLFSKRPPSFSSAAKGQVEWNNEHSVLNSALLLFPSIVPGTLLDAAAAAAVVQS